jgi:nitrogen fixation protein FixH
MNYALLLSLALIWSAPAVAQHAHSAKGPNGGQMEDVAGVHAELLTAGNTITINVFDESNKPVATKRFTASALAVRGSARETVTLVPSGENALKGDAKSAVEGAAITVTLKTAAGKSGQARFKP